MGYKSPAGLVLQIVRALIRGSGGFEGQEIGELNTLKFYLKNLSFVLRV